MFEFLKKKLFKSVSDISKSVEENAKEEVVLVPKEQPVEKQGFFKKLFSKKEEPKDVKPISEIKEEQKIETKKEEEKRLVIESEETNTAIKTEEKKLVTEEIKVVPKPEVKSVPDKKKDIVKIDEEIKEGKYQEKKDSIIGIIKEKIVAKKITETEFEDLFFELEVGLLENNVAVEVIDKIKSDLKATLVNESIRRGQVESVILNTLKKSLYEIVSFDTLDIIAKIKATKKRPFVICFVGINGSGKTTTIAKFVKFLKDNNITSVIAAGDTFRAAAIQQLEEHANKLKVRLIKHDYGSDPASVAFDAIKYAESKNIDVVLIDTAGRLQSNKNLIEEMKKIIRVSKPDFKIFIGESITGNDCIEQARVFNEAIGIDGIILSKADVDDKGGAAISVSFVTKKPILFLGTGQNYSDLEEFNSENILNTLGF